MSKYGEPWFYHFAEDREGKEWAEFMTKDHRSVFSTSDMLLFAGDPANDADRIIACVNACAGMDDPGKEIADLREQNNSLLLLLADIRAAAGDPSGRLMQDDLIEHIRTFRRTLLSL